MIKEKNFTYENLKHRDLELVYMTQYGWHRYDDKGNMNSTVKQNYVLHVVLNGKGIYKVKKNTFTIQKNQAFIIKPTEIVYYYPIESEVEKFEYIWIGIDGKDVDKVLKKLMFENNYVVDLKDTSELKKYIDLMCEQTMSNFKIQGLFYQLLEEIESNLIRIDNVFRYKNKFDDRLLEYIKSNIKEVSVAKLCEKFNFERTSLYKYFIREFKISPIEYILNNKLENARELIAETHIDLNTICVNSGFNNYSHFCRIFKQKYNYSPSAYRRLNYREDVLNE